MAYLKLLILMLILFSYSVTLGRSQNDRLPSIRRVYKVYRVCPQNEQHLNLLKKWQQKATNFQLDFWKEARFLGDCADIMISPVIAKSVKKVLQDKRFRYTITISDVQKLIERNEKRFANIKTNKTFMEGGKWFKDEILLDKVEFDSAEKKVGDLKVKYQFGDYRSYKEMIRYMRTIEFYYPHITKIIRIGTTTENIPIEGIKLFFWIGKPLDGIRKRAFWIDANIHAREWASSHTAIYFINQLVSGYGTDPQITFYVNKLDFFIFPCLNPDGYEYSRSSSEPQVRLWRKNRSASKCVRSFWGEQYCCKGVDLNRNFGFHWAETGTSTNPCSNIYHGDRAFSEPESRAVKDFLMSKEMAGRLDGFITLHTYAQFWIHPFSHMTDAYSKDVIELKITARKAVNKLESVYGTKYRIGTGANLLSPASGGSDDWAKSVLGVKYVYLIELRPEFELSNGFILNKDELLPTAVETWEGVKEVINSVIYNGSAEPFSKLNERWIQKQINRQQAIAEPQSLFKKQVSEEAARKYKQTPPRIVVEGTSEPRALAKEVSISMLNQLENSSSVGTKNETKFDRDTAVKQSDHLIRRDLQTTLQNDQLSTIISKNSSNFVVLPLTVKPAKKSCKDRMVSCRFWYARNRNVCRSENFLMLQQCPYTCRFCR